MATEIEEPRTEAEDQDPGAEEQEVEGGPVKPFLEHLEDLRWVLIKTVSTLLVAMVFCLAAGDKMVSILKRPLDKAKVRFPTNVQVVTLMFGTNRIGIFQFDTKTQISPVPDTNRFVAYKLVPIPEGTNLVLTMQKDEQASAVNSQKLNVDLTNFSPIGGFVVALQVAFYGGIVLSAPFIFFFVAQFVFPALRLIEKKYVYRGLFFGVLLFSGGVSFCYFALLPLALAVSQQYSHWLGFSANQWRAEEYIGFVCKFMLGMGLGFEMPVVLLTLVKIGVLNYRILAGARRYMIVINLVLGALLTTPEVMTQVMMAVPMQILYEISVWITWYWERRDRKRAEKLQAAGETEA